MLRTKTLLYITFDLQFNVQLAKMNGLKTPAKIKWFNKEENSKKTCAH